jgi:hypothetical protein
MTNPNFSPQPQEPQLLPCVSPETVATVNERISQDRKSFYREALTSLQNDQPEIYQFIHIISLDTGRMMKDLADINTTGQMITAALLTHEMFKAQAASEGKTLPKVTENTRLGVLRDMNQIERPEFLDESLEAMNAAQPNLLGALHEMAVQYGQDAAEKTQSHEIGCLVIDGVVLSSGSVVRMLEAQARNDYLEAQFNA